MSLSVSESSTPPMLEPMLRKHLGMTDTNEPLHLYTLLDCSNAILSMPHDAIFQQQSQLIGQIADLETQRSKTTVVGYNVSGGAVWSSVEFKRPGVEADLNLHKRLEFLGNHLNPVDLAIDEAVDQLRYRFGKRVLLIVTGASGINSRACRKAVRRAERHGIQVLAVYFNKYPEFDYRGEEMGMPEAFGGGWIQTETYRDALNQLSKAPARPTAKPKTSLLRRRSLQGSAN